MTDTRHMTEQEFRSYLRGLRGEPQKPTLLDRDHRAMVCLRGTIGSILRSFQAWSEPPTLCIGEESRMLLRPFTTSEGLLDVQMDGVKPYVVAAGMAGDWIRFLNPEGLPIFGLKPQWLYESFCDSLGSNVMRALRTFDAFAGESSAIASEVGGFLRGSHLSLAPRDVLVEDERRRHDLRTWLQQGGIRSAVQVKIPMRKDDDVRVSILVSGDYSCSIRSGSTEGYHQLPFAFVMEMP